MIKFRQPTHEEMLAELDRVREMPFTHDQIGSLRCKKPPGFNRDVGRVQLGTGRSAFEDGCEAIQQWKMFPHPMSQLVAREYSLSCDTVVGVVFRGGPLWTFNPARLAYLIDERVGEYTRYGFAYATLPGHLERGEEHFIVEWNHQNGEVWYEVKADSRPDHWLVKVGYFYARLQQSKFRRLSCAAMRQAVCDSPRPVSN